MLDKCYLLNYSLIKRICTEHVLTPGTVLDPGDCVLAPMWPAFQPERTTGKPLHGVILGSMMVKKNTAQVVTLILQEALLFCLRPLRRTSWRG